MASVSVSHMILFIASILVAASVAGVFTNSISQVSEAVDQRGVSLSKDVRTDIEIISDSGSSNVYYGTDTITIHVKNTGSETLTAEPEQRGGFVNGKYQTTGNMKVTLLNGASTWGPGDVAKVEISNQGDSLSGDHRVKVIINQDEEVFKFNT